MNVATEVFRLKLLQDRLLVLDMLYLFPSTDGVLGEALHCKELPTLCVPHQLDLAEAALSEELQHLKVI